MFACMARPAITPVAYQVSKKNSNPSFSAFDVGVQGLCNANFSQPIRFKVFSWDKSKTLVVRWW